jgi:Thiolase, N-terminal domain
MQFLYVKFGAFLNYHIPYLFGIKGFVVVVVLNYHIIQNKFGRKGSRFGHDTLVDGMLKDGLWDVYTDCAMGNCAELCADNHSITREEQVMLLFFLFLQS